MIRQHEKGISSRQLAAQFGVGKTQINYIVTAKADILKLWNDGVSGRQKLVVVRKCLYADLNTKVFDWFCLKCILPDNNLIQYNNACIIIMPGFSVGPEKEVPPQQRSPAL